MKKIHLYLLLTLGLTLGVSDLLPQLSAQDNYRIAGRVFTTTGHSMPNVEVSLVGDQQTWLDTTGVDGVYSFSEIPKDKDYEVQFKKDGGNANGVSAFDMEMLSRHLLGFGGLNINGIFAGDIGGIWGLSTMDVIAILRLVLLEEDYLFSRSWQFVYAYSDIDPGTPFVPMPPPDIRFHLNSYPIFQLNQNLENIDFVGSKMGDMNQSANPFE